ncbi:hypothetical protein AVEN_48846-1 [Araneus ventricosus]|uniref:Uncharacterized protein n=1 Tax=Araneus ventricosus TaxID=182803 RepID=A0A4Y2AHX4_ARAVE|nr:hypothetical protein AVEN_48846-1 [Araneus ventricosus]
MDLVILNRGQMPRTTSEPVTPLRTSVQTRGRAFGPHGFSTRPGYTTIIRWNRVSDWNPSAPDRGLTIRLPWPLPCCRRNVRMLRCGSTELVLPSCYCHYFCNVLYRNHFVKLPCYRRSDTIFLQCCMETVQEGR